MRVLTASMLLTGLLTSACRDNNAEQIAAEVEQGRQLYAVNGCGTCHGLQGAGDGPLAKTLTPPPRNFRDANAFKNGTDPSSIANTIATGLTRDGGQMQSYFHLSERERYLLARFVISLRESSSPTGSNHD
jgi:high-affinity iron transporter